MLKVERCLIVNTGKLRLWAGSVVALVVVLCAQAWGLSRLPMAPGTWGGLLIVNTGKLRLWAGSVVALVVALCAQAWAYHACPWHPAPGGALDRQHGQASFVGWFRCCVGGCLVCAGMGPITLAHGTRHLGGLLIVNTGKLRLWAGSVVGLVVALCAQAQGLSRLPMAPGTWGA